MLSVPLSMLLFPSVLGSVDVRIMSREFEGLFLEVGAAVTFRPSVMFLPG